MAKDWTREEVTLIVKDYFDMLVCELQGQPYNKAAHNRTLQKLIQRGKGAIEFKHQNISAVLVEAGMPYIFGYKPRYNAQGLLKEAVLNYVDLHAELLRLFEQFAQALPPTQATKKADYSKALLDVDLPTIAADIAIEYHPKRGRKVNYLQQEQANSKLGRLGEAWALSYEKWQLTVADKANYADKVEWVSDTQGDGLGYDIKSVQANGKDKYIEVKTTKLAGTVPFYFTDNELKFSQRHSHSYYLYRVYNFYMAPKLFIRQGAFNDFCHITPTNYTGHLKS